MPSKVSPLDEMQRIAKVLLDLARSNRLSLVTAESCTAGLLGQTLADAPGAAQLFHGTFVTYTKSQKTIALGVPENLLRSRGAVCREVAIAMAEGALKRSAASLAGAITGVAGPEPDEDSNPVGRICIAVSMQGGAARVCERNYGDLGRDAIRQRAALDVLKMLVEMAATSHGEERRVSGCNR